MAQNNLMLPRDRLPQPAIIELLDTKPEVNFQSGRFFIHDVDFESHIALISHQCIQTFAVFARDNHKCLVMVI